MKKERFRLARYPDSIHGVGRTPIELRRDLGAAARLWSSPDHLAVGEWWWTAFSGELSVTYNVACCQSSDNDVLVDHCLQPLLDLKKPGIIMLAGPGLATAQKLADAGWVGVGALPLMLLTELPPSDHRESDVRSLTEEDLPEARELLADTYSLSDAAAAAAVPLRAVEDLTLGVWGLFDQGRMVSSFTGATEDGLVVVWSMATRRTPRATATGGDCWTPPCAPGSTPGPRVRCSSRRRPARSSTADSATRWSSIGNCGRGRAG